MPRFNFIKKNFLKRDILYNSFLVSLFISNILKNGNKNLAGVLVYKTLKLLQRKTRNVLKYLETAINCVRPRIKLKELEFKKGAKTAVIPFELFKSIRTVIKWIINNAIKRSKKPFYYNLACEIIDCIKKRGLTHRKKKDFHRYINLKKTAFMVG